MEVNKVLIFRIAALVLAALSFLMIGLSEGKSLIGDILMYVSYVVALVAAALGVKTMTSGNNNKIFIIGHIIALVVLIPSIFVFYKVGAYPAVLLIVSAIVIEYTFEYFDQKF